MIKKISKNIKSYQKYALDNGIRIVTVPMRQVKTVTALVVIGAGSRYEKKNLNGISHFLEHMIFKGTKKRPSALEISSLIDGVGGEFNAFTGKEVVAYYIKAAANHLELLIDVLSDMLLNSLYDRQELDRERGVIVEELNLYEDTPMRKITDLYEGLIWGDQPLGWDTGGKKEVIRKISRDDMLRYTKQHYAPENLVVALAGNLNNQKAIFLVEKYLGQMVKSSFKPFLPVHDDQKKPQTLVHYKKTDQAHLCLGVRSFPLTHPDRFVLEVLNVILGGGMSSRLFINIREKRGLAYYVRSSADFYFDAGTLVAQAGLDLKRIDEAIEVMLVEFKRMATEFVTDEELVRGKEFLSGRLLLELEDTKNVATRYGLDELVEKRIIWEDEIIEKIKKVTQEDILRVAKEIFVNHGLNLAVIGPFKESSKFERLLRL